MRYYLDYFLHFLFSRSRHGTHSPFVYDLADKAIYKVSEVKEIQSRKSNLLIHEIADYFGVTYTLSHQEVGEGMALYVEDVVTTVEELAKLQYRFRYIVLAGIYNGKNNKGRWRQVCEDERFVVTIDLFFFGLICYRKEQPKENFKLRFPFWKYL